MTTAVSPKPRAKGKSAKELLDEMVEQHEPLPGQMELPINQLSEAEKDEALRLLLHPTSRDAFYWEAIRKGKVAGEAQVVHDPVAFRLNQIWNKVVSCKKPTACANAKGGVPLVWFGSAKPNGTPSLSGDELRAAVRRVLNLPDPEAVSVATKSPGKGKKGAKLAEEPVTAGDLLAGIEVLFEQEVPFDQIQRSEENPRLAFDETLIADMAPTIETICRMNPLTIRENSFELIDGETRHRAGEVAKVKSLRCKIIRCSDAQAATIRLLTSLQRRDLNPIERAKGIKALQEKHGLSQRALEDVLQLKQGTISNYVRLLDLPDEWQQRVISGEISALTIRDLLPFADEPAVLKELAEQLDTFDPEFRNAEFKGELRMTLRGMSQPLQRWESYLGKLLALKPTEEQRQELRIRKIEGEERAFNKELCEQLIKLELEKVAERQAKRMEKASGSMAATGKTENEVRASEKRQAEIFQKLVYRFKIAWLQSMVNSKLAQATDQQLLKLLLYFSTQPNLHLRDETLVDGLGLERERYGMPPEKMLGGVLQITDGNAWEVVRDCVANWVSSPFDASRTDVPPAVIEVLAKEFNVDAKRDWAKSFVEGAPCEGILENYIQLLTKDQLAELMKEWKLSYFPAGDAAETRAIATAKRGDLVEFLATSGIGKPCPAAVIDVEPCTIF